MADRGFDVVVIGAGIAGASVAFELQRRGIRTLLLEREELPGYHATGRSAAVYLKSYGNPTIRALTAAAEAFYRQPPAGFADHPLLAARGFVAIARPDQRPRLLREAAFAQRFVPAVEILDEAALHERVPLLRPGYAALGLLDPTAADLDVAAILQGYLRLFRRLGGELRTGEPVVGLEQQGRAWQVRSRQATVACGAVVDAAGAWADEVARLAGLDPLGLRPLRRTAFTIRAPGDLDLRSLPLVADIDEQFYLKPEPGRLLCSPADETPSPPCDAAPDELDIALAAEHVQRAFRLDIQRIERSWAGLRTFAPDRTPVLGFDPRASGFFWLAGQGGYGLQTAPAMARLAAALVSGEALPPDLAAIEPALRPERLIDGRLVVG